MQQKSIFFLFIVIGAVIAIPFGFLALIHSSLAYAVVGGIGIGILVPSFLGIFLFGTNHPFNEDQAKSIPELQVTQKNTEIKTSNKPEDIKSNIIARTPAHLESGVPLKPSGSHSNSIKSNSEFIQKIIKLGEMVQECQELVDGEPELTKREQTRLYLKRDEFKKLYQEIKSSKFDCF